MPAHPTMTSAPNRMSARLALSVFAAYLHCGLRGAVIGARPVGERRIDDAMDRDESDDHDGQIRATSAIVRARLRLRTVMLITVRRRWPARAAARYSDRARWDTPMRWSRSRISAGQLHGREDFAGFGTPDLHGAFGRIHVSAAHSGVSECLGGVRDGPRDDPVEITGSERVIFTGSCNCNPVNARPNEKCQVTALPPTGGLMIVET